MTGDENAAIARLEEEARERAGPQLARDLRIVLAALKRIRAESTPSAQIVWQQIAWQQERETLIAALKRETERAILFQRERAELADQLHGTPCAQIAWQQEREALLAENETLKARDWEKGMVWK